MGKSTLGVAMSGESSSLPVRLSETELQLVDVCIRIAQFLGLPKSVGEIYGLLFISSDPLAMDDLVGRLGLSKGSASQGLKLLREFGAVRVVYRAGDRRDLYVAEADVSSLMAGFLRERVQPGVRHLGQRLDAIEAQAKKEPAVHLARLARLRQWQRAAEKALPALSKQLS